MAVTLRKGNSGESAAEEPPKGELCGRAAKPRSPGSISCSTKKEMILLAINRKPCYYEYPCRIRGFSIRNREEIAHPMAYF
jgi:hypothetical protein